MISKESYIQEYEFQLNEWSLKIEALQSLYDNSEKDQKDRLNGHLDNLWENLKRSNRGLAKYVQVIMSGFLYWKQQMNAGTI